MYFRFAPFFDLHFEIDSKGGLRTKLLDKLDYFNFLIVNFPFICRNIHPAIMTSHEERDELGLQTEL
jgi:hypothetical protein